jgi:hypothetical protein
MREPGWIGELVMGTVFLSPFAWMIVQFYKAVAAPLTAGYEAETIIICLLFGLLIGSLAGYERAKEAEALALWIAKRFRSKPSDDGGDANT